MTEKQKAYDAFESFINSNLKKAEAKLETRIIKKMNATDNAGNVYASESEIMDAYGFDLITDAERRRLLQALEYRENRPMLKEDHLISLCKKALSIIGEERYKDELAVKEQNRKNKIAEIHHKGNSPKFCICCGEIIGEVLGGNLIGTDWYDNHEKCATGHVCKSCQSKCPGKSKCKLNDIDKE